MAYVKELVSVAAVFLLTSYPFANAFFMLMFLKEKTKHVSNPPTEMVLLLAHMGAYIVSGIFMKLRVKLTIVIFVFMTEVLLLAAHLHYLSPSLGYTYWAKWRHAARVLGVIASYMLFVSIVKQSPRLYRLSRLLFTAYTVFCAILLSLDPTYPFAYERFGRWLRLSFNPTMGMTCAGVTLLLLSGFCLLSARTVRLATLWVAAMLVLIVGSVDAKIGVWTRKHRLDFWMGIRLAADNMLVVIALVLTYSKSFKTSKKTD